MDDAVKDLLWVLLFLVIVAIMWYKTGGPLRPSATSGPFLDQPQEKHTEEVVRGTQEAVSQGEQSVQEILDPISQEPTTESAYKYKATLSVGYRTKVTNPQEEYLEVTASSYNDKPLRITGWTLEGKKGLAIKIKQGVYLPYAGQVNPKQDIFLRPGEKAVIITGHSPLGFSFRLNKCIGYFEQYQDFIPSLPHKCPYLEEQEIPSNLNDACLDYIENLPRCKMQLTVPTTLSHECQVFIKENLDYASCVTEYKNKGNFYEPEWRIYLGRDSELWKSKRETIILKDENGKIIDWDSY